MEVRCSGCTKLFRVSDDKITGAGIKFACSRCGNSVKITSEEFERHKLSREAASALESFVPKPPKSAATALLEPEGENSSVNADFDLSDPATAAAAMQQEEQPPVFVKPDPVQSVPEIAAKNAVKPVVPQAPTKTGPLPAPQPSPVAAPATAPAQPKLQPRPTAPVRSVQSEVKAPPKPAVPSVRPASAPQPRGGKEPARPASAVVTASQPAAGSNAGMKVAIALVALIVLGTAGYFAKPFFSSSASSGKHSIDIGKDVTPEGLQIVNASGVVDPVSGDLIITGTIENSMDKARPAWYVVVDLLDAKGTSLMQARLVSGKYFYTRRDMEILGKRGTNIQELKAKQLQEQGVVIPARGSHSFEVRILEPPIGVANFNANLQPFDPVKLYKEMSEAQK